MSGPNYECKKCATLFSSEDYKINVYCPQCGLHLWRKSLTPAPFNVDALFEKFTNLKGFQPAEGVSYDNLPLWIAARKKAYAKYQEKLDPAKLRTNENWSLDYKDFLYFKNNQSWGTLTRTGTDALKEPEKLQKLLTYLQDESVGIEKRFQESLEGQYRCLGITQNILTCLLHTFHPDKYGVWSTRTDVTLKIIQRAPIMTQYPGRNYAAINGTLNKLAKELKTDLTTIDGFMWFVSKELGI